MKKSSKPRSVAGCLLISLLAFGSLTASGSAHTLCAGFLPENDLRIPVGMYRNSQVTEAVFNQVLDRVEQIYKPEIEAAGDTLNIRRLWTNATVNASAERIGRTVVLNMYGGLARHPTVTPDGFALVACHEMGHHLGGAPKYSTSLNWASNEGQADYFSTLKCLRRYFALDDNSQIGQDTTLDPVAVTSCTAQHANADDLALCLRNSQAGQSIANLFKELRGQTVAPQYGTPDTKEVARTQDGHPDTQCRLDTYFAGLNCAVSVNDPVDKLDYKKGSCFTPNDTVGFRPRCWFKPPN
jgi:hypothetical protein